MIIDKPQIKKDFLDVNKNIINIFLVSKILVLAISFYAVWKLSGFNHFPNWHEWLLAWNRWDTVHYINIADNGYPSSGKLLGFFPILPLLIYLFNFIFHNSIISGLIITFIASYFCLFYFYKLLDIEKVDKTIIKRALLLFVTFTSAIFLSAVYTESLFIFLILAAFYYFRKNNWFWCFLLLSLATLTRSTGILPWPIFLWYFFQKKAYTNIKHILWALLPAFAMALFMFLEKSVSGDWLAYAHAQVDYWYRPYTNFWITFTNTLNQIDFSTLGKFWQQQIIYASLSLLIIIYSFLIKKIPQIYNWYMLLNWLTFTSFNYLASIPRYIIILFPMFWLLAILAKNKIVYYFLVGLFLFLMIRGSMTFLAGQLFY